MFVRALAMRLKARAVTTKSKIDTNSHKSAVDHRARETSSLSCQKTCGIQRGFDSGGQQTTEREMGDESTTPLVMEFIRASEVVTLRYTRHGRTRRVPVPRSQLHRLVADGIELVDGRLRLAGKASETLRSSSYMYLPSSSGWHG